MNYCHNCGHSLNVNKDGFTACCGKSDMILWKSEFDTRPKERCGQFVHWNNPTPVVGVIVPYYEPYPDDMEMVQRPHANRIVLVQRKLDHIGEWCLPCGFLDEREDPKHGGKRECKEEIGVDVNIIKMHEPIILVNTNRLLLVYEAELMMNTEFTAGDDAMAVGIFKPNRLPKIAFPTHKEIIENFFKDKHV
jgi:ADP-ribose pyrophosphatase YjhB (NUDIX family)